MDTSSQRLRAFAAVAEYGSFVRASEQLGLTASAMSQTIRIVRGSRQIVFAVAVKFVVVRMTTRYELSDVQCATRRTHQASRRDVCHRVRLVGDSVDRIGSGKIDFRLDGLHALVTGAGRGLGAEISLALAASGANVYAMSRSAEDLQEVVNQIRSNGGKASAIVCDVTDPAAFDRALATIERLDVLVNNAGTNFPGPFLDTTAEHLDAMLLLNVRAVFMSAQSCARKMIADGSNGGCIIHMSSQMGHVGSALRTAYCMTKHAVEGLTKAMAVELAPHGIRVNSVAPTFVETPLTARFFEDPAFKDWVMARLPMRRLLPATDVADAVCYLASHMATMITGTSLRLDGGWTAQ